MLGEGGFGKVFKGWVDPKTYAASKVGVGIPVAVKKSSPDSEQGLKEWQDFNAKLSDFGLAKFGPVDSNSHVTTDIVGMYGYAAPEYMSTGHLYVKSDVYGFGVVLLEIITGMRVLDSSRQPHQYNLVKWTKPLLPNKNKLRNLMDPRLEHGYPFQAASQVAELIIRCLNPQCKLRPDMEQVLGKVEKISKMEMTPKDLKAQTKHLKDEERRLRKRSSTLPTNHGGIGHTGGGHSQHEYQSY
ncbi:unnamed protein product [Cuscuta europaea]|uniref:Protein kinase domain-containing protein n=1 Tax=Cuscuta europaea TaxID=41803 RepID=A0A9P0ZWJ0_CUSEU|nr:unnamed protein product [Cuscuta europaea]